MNEVRIERTPKRVRALKNGLTVVDSQAARLLYGAFRYAYYIFPIEDIQAELLIDQYEDIDNKWLKTVRQIDLRLGGEILSKAVGTYVNSVIGTADLEGLDDDRWQTAT